MGEISDAMLDGTLCEGCGEYIGDESGFARYCSSECRSGRMADAPIDTMFPKSAAGIRKALKKKK